MPWHTMYRRIYMRVYQFLLYFHAILCYMKPSCLIITHHKNGFCAFFSLSVSGFSTYMYLSLKIPIGVSFIFFLHTHCCVIIRLCSHYFASLELLFSCSDSTLSPPLTFSPLNGYRLCYCCSCLPAVNIFSLFIIPFLINLFY